MIHALISMVGFILLTLVSAALVHHVLRNAVKIFTALTMLPPEQIAQMRSVPHQRAWSATPRLPAQRAHPIFS